MHFLCMWKKKVWHTLNTSIMKCLLCFLFSLFYKFIKKLLNLPSISNSSQLRICSFTSDVNIYSVDRPVFCFLNNLSFAMSVFPPFILPLIFPFSATMKMLNKYKGIHCTAFACVTRRVFVLTNQAEKFVKHFG